MYHFVYWDPRITSPSRVLLSPSPVVEQCCLRDACAALCRALAHELRHEVRCVTALMRPCAAHHHPTASCTQHTLLPYASSSPSSSSPTSKPSRTHAATARTVTIVLSVINVHVLTRNTVLCASIVITASTAACARCVTWAKG